MIEITFDRYVELDEKSEKKKVAKGYVLPKLEFISNNLNTEDELCNAMIAFHNACNKEYADAVQKIFYEQVIFCENEVPAENQANVNKNLLQITERVGKMEFQPEDFFCPTVAQMRTYLTNSEQDMAFLLWLQNSLINREKKDESEEAAIKWINARLNRMAKKVERECESGNV